MTEAIQQQAAVPARDNEVGETLARARAALGLSLEECAQQIKFSPKKLEALEQGRYDVLPGGTFARGMLRAYARLLNLDADSLVPRIAQQVHMPDTTDAAVSLRRPIPFSQANKQGNFLYAGLSVAALVIVAWVGYEWQQERSGAAKLKFVPAAQAPLEQAKPAVVATVTPVVAPIRQDSVAEEKPAAQPATDSREQAKADAEPSASADTSKRRIVMRFAGEAWVEIRGGDGKTLHSQVNQPGTERVVDGEPPFTIVVGNARHVSLIYDDQTVELAPHTKVDVARLTLK